MTKIKTEQAIALVRAVTWGAMDDAECVAKLASFRRDRVAMLVLEGCKLTSKQRGCVTTYYLDGYAADGSDVEMALSAVTWEA